jgi:thiamine biosynthesis lipoprotein ApbE
VADALATGVFVMGPVKGLALVERLGFGAVIVDAGGGISISSTLRQRVKVNP